MNEYYGVPSTPNDSFLKHYGVKGMKWGVRKAREHQNNKRLAKHYLKAQTKLHKLKKNADILKNYDMRREAPAFIGAGALPLAAGVSLPLMTKLSLRDYEIAGINAAIGAGSVGAGIHNAVVSGKRTKLKGHTKAVNKVNEWQKEMKNAFKGTKYEKVENSRPEYKDIYTLYEHGILGKDSNGRNIPYRAPTISVNGSDLVRDRNTKAKKIFKKRLSEPPVTQKTSDSKVLLAVQSPSGRIYPASFVDSWIKTNKKRRRG